MCDISKIDKNFKIETKIDKPDIKFYDVKSGVFDVYGLYNFFENNNYCRMNPEVADSLQSGAGALNWCTAGGRIRFKTNSQYVAINRKLTFFKDGGGKMSHMTATGSSGYDLYLVENGEQIYYKSFIVPHGFGEDYENVVEFENNDERDIIIHFPLYNGCSQMYIGLQENAEIKHGSNYKYEKPMVIYGSSITQGGCASRPGNAYSNMLSRWLDADHINLGFAGNAKGEDIMAEYIANLDMSIFVYDYDHNAPTNEHLEKTHERFFKIFREKQPDTPVVIMSRVDIPTTPGGVVTEEIRKAIIRKTYDNAVNAGDKNVYFIDGKEIFKLAGYRDCTVDGCHPNDLGFYCMAKAVEKAIKDNNLLK